MSSGLDQGTSSAGACRRTALRLAAPLLLSGAFVLGVVPSATAQRSDHAFPDRAQVEAAERRVEVATLDVGAVKAALLLANRRLEEAAVRAEMASEEYNGAMWRLEQSQQELATARSDAAAARRTVAAQRDALGALVAASYQQDSEVTALSAMMGADGPEGVLDQYATFAGASSSMQADYDRFAASDALARSFEERAEEVRVEAEDLAEQARLAKVAATEAAAAAATQAATIADDKDRLIRRLAALQDISVSLARERQMALEELARERAAARAEAEARAAAAAQAAEDRRARAAAARAARAAAAEARAEARAQARAQAAREAREARETRRSRAGTDPDTTPEPPPPASPPPAPAPPPPATPPAGRGGADRAIAFAKAQLGDPYVWGAAGPSSWDCSGLMLEAWARAGVALPHYSVAQYYAGTPIQASSLRPGDLVFWGSTNSPDSIHHVAMYLGDGQIVHAPRTGRPVSIDSLYYWIPPNFFVRL